MIDLKQNQKSDPVVKQQEKGLEQQEDSPMDPPEAYEGTGVDGINPDNFSPAINILVTEHHNVMVSIEAFEKAIVDYKTNGYQMTGDINKSFAGFFKCLDEEILPHNRKEEKVLFPILNKKLIEAGEHGKGDKPVTAIDIMEDDHVKFIQLGALAFNLLGLATRITDDRSRIFVLDTAYETSRELVELLKLHIYREDVTLFPLAQKYIPLDILTKMESELR